MKQLKDQISHLSASRSLKGEDGSSLLQDFSSSLKISNSEIKYQLQHGVAFKDLLDPRDTVLEHDFDFS